MLISTEGLTGSMKYTFKVTHMTGKFFLAVDLGASVSL